MATRAGLGCRRRRRDRGSAKNADRPMDQSREARHPARLPPAYSPDAPRPSMKRAIPCQGLDPTERPTRRRARVAMTLAPAASAGRTLTGRGPGMCSVTAMRPAQNRAVPDTDDQRCCSAGLLALWRRADPLHPHSTTDVVGDGCERRLNSISAGQSMCGAPRRNRTGDPILTMDRQPSAVLSHVLGCVRRHRRYCSYVLSCRPRTVGTLLAAMAMPRPVPQTSRARSCSPRATASATSAATSG